jgi:hypothetical protein
MAIGTHCSDDEDSKYLWLCSAQQPRTRSSSHSPPWEP